MSDSQIVNANPEVNSWTDGLSEEHKTFVTEKGFKTPTDILSAWPKESSVWTDGLTSDQKGALESKGFENLGTLVDSYVNLEKLKGVPENQLLKIPEKSTTDDPEAWNALFTKLGRPEKSDGYEIEVPKDGGADEKTINWAKETFHGLGLTKTQAEGFITKWNEWVASQSADVEEQAQVAMAAAEKELKTKWGMAYEKNLNIAKMAAKQFGITQEEAAQMATVMGDAKFMELWHRIGDGMGEHNFVSGDTVKQGLKSPEAAKYEIDELMTDENFQKKMLEGDREAKQKWDRLHQMAYPG